MAANSTMIHKLQQAINGKGRRLLYSTSQFYSVEQNRPATIYHIKEAEIDELSGKTKNIELFKSTSQIQIVLFLRDLWYEINGWELPNDNPIWTEKRGSIR